jgi:DNA-binding ferritin-like protein
MTPKKACGCESAAPNPREEGTEVVWHDPTKYDPLRHGPPYMPVRMAREAKAVVRRVASAHVSPRVARRFIGSGLGSGIEGSPLSAVLSVLRAASFLHQTHHWQTSGPSYYADHLLFDRLYKDSQSFIDQVAEKAVGLGSADLVTPSRQAEQIAQMVGAVASPDASAANLVKASLRVESLVLAIVDETLSVLSSTESLTPGADNLLQGVADLHETFVYLLQQRESAVYEYAR